MMCDEKEGGYRKLWSEVPTIFKTGINENSGNAPFRVSTVVLNSDSYECTTGSEARATTGATTNNLLKEGMPDRVSFF
jgi:hypothetical protein